MKNTVQIKITGYPLNWDGRIGTPQTDQSKEIQLATILDKICYLRFARKIGDAETVNHTQLGKLQDSSIQFIKL